jgi:hypothetical protein
VVPVVVGVDHPTDRKVGQSLQILGQLIGLGECGSGVHHQDPLATDHGPDVLIQELVVPSKAAVPNFFP